MLVVYLDQNKWIELARAIKYPTEHSHLAALIRKVSDAIRCEKLVLPLTATNIVESHKINDDQRRHDLSITQSIISGGKVIRGRRRRKLEELKKVIASCVGQEAPFIAPHWFLSNVFFEAFSEWQHLEPTIDASAKVVQSVATRPAESLYDYLINTPDDVRRAAARHFTEGSERLRTIVEERRTRHFNESESLRRKIYSALLLIEDIEFVLSVANELGVPWHSVTDVGSSNARRIINDVPTYFIERELALRLEAQSRPIHENDFRDMQSFCAAIPYVDLLIGENQFVNLARQAGLGKKFNTRLETDLNCLADFLV